MCNECGTKHQDVWYAPTCDVKEFTCDNCDFVIDLERYTGISEEEASNRDVIDGVARASWESVSPVRLSVARVWSARWKRAAKFWYNTALGQRTHFREKIRRQAEQITRLERAKTDSGKCIKRLQKRMKRLEGKDYDDTTS